MNDKFLLVPVLAALLLAGCGNQANTSATASPKTEQAADVPPPPVIDTTTPDKAVKSLWATIDWSKAVNQARLDRYQPTADEMALKRLEAQLSVPAIASPKVEKTQRQQYSREILKADVETESRAIVMAQIKNVTPFSADTVLSKYQLKAREQGERVKYVLEKNAGSWQISEAWEWKDYSNEFTKSRPIEGKAYPIYVFDAW